MGKLERKIALVTGGTSGIGLATATRFVSEGAYVFITGRRDSELPAAVKEIGKNVTGIQGDVSKLADLDRSSAPGRRQNIGHTVPRIVDLSARRDRARRQGRHRALRNRRRRQPPRAACGRGGRAARLARVVATLQRRAAVPRRDSQRRAGHAELEGDAQGERRHHAGRCARLLRRRRSARRSGRPSPTARWSRSSLR